MYMNYFGLAHRPFGKDIPSDELFASAGTQDDQTRLAHLVDMGGIGVHRGAYPTHLDPRRGPRGCAVTSWRKCDS